MAHGAGIYVLRVKNQRKLIKMSAIYENQVGFSSVGKSAEVSAKSSVDAFLTWLSTVQNEEDL